MQSKKASRQKRGTRQGLEIGGSPAHGGNGKGVREGRVNNLPNDG